MPSGPQVALPYWLHTLFSLLITILFPRIYNLGDLGNMNIFKIFQKQRHPIHIVPLFLGFLTARWLLTLQLSILSEDVPENQGKSGSPFMIWIWKSHSLLVKAVYHILLVKAVPIDERMARVQCKKACGTRDIAASISGKYNVFYNGIHIFIEFLRISPQTTYNCKGKEKCPYTIKIKRDVYQ